MSLLHEDIIGCFSQYPNRLIREGPFASFYKIMIEGGVGVSWRADGHIGKVQVVNGVSGDCGGNGILLPLLVRLANQDSSSDEPKADN